MFKKRFSLIDFAFFCLMMLPLLTQGEMGNIKRTAPQTGPVNLSDAVLILVPAMSGPEKKASEMLLDEVEKRSGVRWKVTNKLSDEGRGVLYWVNEKRSFAPSPLLPMI